MDKNNVYKITELAFNASEWDLNSTEFDIMLHQIGGGLFAREMVGIYTSQYFTVSILPDEDFKVAIQTENTSSIEVTADYLEETKKVMRLKNAIQILVNEIKPYL